GLVPGEEAASAGDQQREASLIELLIELRRRARAEKNYAESDRIRDELARLGVVLEDRADGTVWKITS
ncbi:MAG: CysS/YqeB C-terminal domain-containing protein, partial [Phototrophicaceae bacterium]